MRHVEHLIVGAGLAGLVLKHFLAGRDVELIDPEPARYKIGESLIPELFRHPEMAALLPRLRALPSRTPKYGTTFIAGNDVFEFPLAERESSISMHVVRSELEREMAAAWNITPRPEKLQSIDFERRIAKTDREEYVVSGQILDCSGPAMVVASLRGEVEKLLPINATWSYWDIAEANDAAFVADIEQKGRSFQRYDPRHQKVIPSMDASGWRPSRMTVLTQIEEGVWTWQIPLFDCRVLSMGVVSRQGPVSPERYREIVKEHAAPCFRLTPRSGPDSDPLFRVHSRNGFARRAKRASGDGFVLLADAFAFSDPVYSVGTGFAVNQAIDVATRLNAGTWDAEESRAYSERCEALIARARAAFELWYTGRVLREPDASRTVQHQLLHGDLFRLELPRQYGNVLEDADLRAGKDPFHSDADGEPLDEEVATLIDVSPGGTVAGWELLGSRRSAGGVQLRFRHGALPDLTLLVQAPDRPEPCYRLAGRMRLSYMRLIDGPYPEAPELVRLFDAFSTRIREREREWVTLVVDGGR